MTPKTSRTLIVEERGSTVSGHWKSRESSFATNAKPHVIETREDQEGNNVETAIDDGERRENRAEIYIISIPSRVDKLGYTVDLRRYPAD